MKPFRYLIPVLLLSACTVTDDPLTPSSDAIAFTGAVAKGFIPDVESRSAFELTGPTDTLYCRQEASRADLTTSETAITDIGVMAYMAWANSTLMDNEHFRRESSGEFATVDSNTKYWPGDPDKTLDFTRIPLTATPA